MDIIKKIEKSYFSKLGKSDYVGIEIEMPLINTEEPYIVNPKIIQSLFKQFLDSDFYINSLDNDENIISIKNRKNGDTISLEYSFNTLEFSLNKDKNIYTLINKFKDYYNFVNEYLKKYNYKVCDVGINPNYHFIDKNCLNQNRYMAIERLLLKEDNILFSQFCAYCCSIQTHINVDKKNLVEVMNVFTKIDNNKNNLFANSYMKETGLKNSRKFLWENSNFGPLNIGPNKIFNSVEDIKLDYLNRNLFYIERDGNFLLLKEKCSLKNYFKKNSTIAVNESGDEIVIKPLESDFDNFRSYKSVELTKYGTLEIRTDCMQNYNKIFKVVAFNVGISLCSKKILNYIDKNNGIDDEALIKIAKEGLKKRGYGEEKLLEDL